MKLKDKIKQAVSGTAQDATEAPVPPGQDPGATPGSQPASHPRKYLDDMLEQNHPGWNLAQLDEMNVSVVPGVPDTHEMSVLRRTIRPSREGGPRRDISHAAQKTKLNDQVRTLIGNTPSLEN